MEENDIWNLEVESNGNQELTEEDKKLISIYSDQDMLSRDILPILDYSLEDNNYEEKN